MLVSGRLYKKSASSGDPKKIVWNLRDFTFDQTKRILWYQSGSGAIKTKMQLHDKLPAKPVASGFETRPFAIEVRLFKITSEGTDTELKRYFVCLLIVCFCQLYHRRKIIKLKCTIIPQFLFYIIS